MILVSVRQVKHRLDKWDHKVKLANKGTKLEAMHSKMKHNAEIQFTNLVNLENKVKLILGEVGIQTMFNVPYLDFARQLYRLNRLYAGDQLKKQVMIIRNKWHARGLDDSIMDRIEKIVIKQTNI